MSSASPETWSRLESKMDKMSEVVQALDGRTIRMDENLKEAHRFQARAEQAQDEVDDKVESIDKRVTGLEALEGKKIDERLMAVEGKIKTVYGIGVGVSAVLSVVSALMLWYLSHVANKLDSLPGG